MRSVLYDAGGHPVGVLTDSTRCHVTQERNGIYEAELDYPMSSPLFSRIGIGCFFDAKPDDLSAVQRFRVYKISKPLYGVVTLYGEHLRYALGGVPAARGTYTGVPSSVIAQMLTSVNGTTEFTAWTDISTVNSVTLDVPASVGKMLAGTEGSLLDVFGGEYEFDNTVIKLHQARGREKSIEIRYARDLTGFTCQSSSSSAYTHVYPFYRSETDNAYVELASPLIGLSGAASLPFERCYMLDLSGDFTDTVPTAAQLEVRARAWIAANRPDEIAYNYRISFVPLWQTEEYKNVASLERCGLCDTVSVIHEPAGERVRAKIIRTVYDSIAERYVEMELGNTTNDFAQTVTQTINKLSNSVKSTRSYLQTVVSRATSQITGNQGGYVVLYDSNGDGEPDEILIMDTPSILTATRVWRWNAAGLGYSASGYGGPYGTAITMQGEIVADFITTGTLNASLIRTGVLLADLIKAGVISDNNGNIEINMNTGKLSMALPDIGKMEIWTNGITFYDENSTVLASMFVSQTGSGVVTANSILVGPRNGERTFIGVDNNSVGYVVTDEVECSTVRLDGHTIGCQSGKVRVPIPVNADISIMDNGTEIGAFYANSGGGTTLKTTALIVSGQHYSARTITVDGTSYTVLAQ